jgi:hypothetical protein
VKFRWQFTDDVIGEQWSKWHATNGPCPACCCGGPDDGEHQEPCPYYDEDGILVSGHTRLDPTDYFPTDVVEFTPGGPC